MDTTKDFEKFVKAESDSDRHAALSRVMASKPSWQKNLQMWQVLALLPTKVEKARLAHSLRMPERPASEWAMVSYLLRDADQDIIGNAINSLTFSRNRALGHRTEHFFTSLERPQRVLYCLARYAEEANDPRFAKFLSFTLASDLSDAFLARTFNALFRLGIKDKVALKVASELVASHIDATNMDRKAAVSAVVYLCFAGSQDDIEKLKTVRDRVSIPELKRLLNWGFAAIDSTKGKGFTESDAALFFERANSEVEPNFTGFGCFEEKTLLAGLKIFLESADANNPGKVTTTVLGLGDVNCIDLLAEHYKFGLAPALASQNEEILSIWRHFMPITSKKFEASVRNPSLFSAWHATNPELLYVALKVDDFVADKKSAKAWQTLFDSLVESNMELATDLVCAQLLALERATNAAVEATQQSSLQKLILTNLATCFKACHDAKDAKVSGLAIQLVTDRLYGTCIGGNFSSSFIAELFKCAPFSITSWAFNAIALSAPELEVQTLKAAIHKELDVILAGLQQGGTAQEDFLLEVVSRLHGVLVGADKFHVTVSEETLKGVHTMATTVQSIFDALDESGKGSDEPESDDESADWSGHVSSDKPILRWNAILQVCLSNNMSAEVAEEHELLLRESMRVAPHVEKRWVVRALAKIGSDDAIKAILYQALQHVDNEFVALTIRELLPSRHPRAQQALIRCVGRNTIPDDLKLVILDDISLDNPEEILQELRTLEILRLPNHIDDAVRDAVGRVAALIQVDTSLPVAAGNTTKITGADIDVIIKKFLPDGDHLSVDVRSALRTAEMILIQSREWGSEAVDLSPIVNMHCKAVELTLRETFEPYTDSLVRKGALSRKLDILGYARPIPEKMQVFEDYLASLPVIKSIPYFSKFKLRKLLRAICLYRPGKRFTLDGPKAFALLFLVAGRKQCTFGLEHVIELDFASDASLFEFIKLVHSLQDSRNRAVHEGLTWEAKDDIEGMRIQAYKIIETCLRIGKFLQKGTVPAGSGGPLEMGA